MTRRHKHDWVECESWSATSGTTLQYRQCRCGRIHVTMFKDGDELRNMIVMWLRFGKVVSMEPIARLISRGAS